MSQIHQLAALIERETDSYVSLCPELDIASQGDTQVRVTPLKKLAGISKRRSSSFSNLPAIRKFGVE